MITNKRSFQLENKINSPCQHFRKCGKSCMENMHTEGLMQNGSVTIVITSIKMSNRILIVQKMTMKMIMK